MTELCSSSEPKSVHDLRGLTCPALFVQFKWHLKHHNYTLGRLKLLLNQAQELTDITHYLDGVAVKYQIIELENGEMYLEIADV